MEAKVFITFENSFNKTAFINSLNINNLFNFTNKLEGNFIDKISNVTGISTLILKPIIICVVAFPLVCFAAWCFLIILFPDTASDSKFERDFSLIVRHIGKVATSIEDGFFDLLDDMTDPATIIPPDGYGFNEQSYMSVMNNQQSSYGQTSQHSPYSLKSLPNTFDSYSSYQLSQQTFVPGPAYLAFALNAKAQRKNMFDKPSLKELISEAKNKNPSYFNPKYDSVPIVKTHIPNYFYELNNQRHQDYQIPLEQEQQKLNGFVQQYSSQQNQPYYYSGEPNSLTNYQSDYQLILNNSNSHSDSFPILSFSHNHSVQFRQSNKFDPRYNNSFTKKETRYTRPSNSFILSNQYKIPVETPNKFKTQTFQISPLLNRELQYIKNNFKRTLNNFTTELMEDNKNKNIKESSRNIKKINLTKAKTGHKGHTLPRPSLSSNNLNKSVSSSTKYKYEEFKPSPKDWFTS